MSMERSLPKYQFWEAGGGGQAEGRDKFWQAGALGGRLGRPGNCQADQRLLAGGCEWHCRITSVQPLGPTCVMFSVDTTRQVELGNT